MSRREDLLSLLFDCGENSLPAAAAAQHLGVSTRTVRAYVNFINREYGDIVESSRAGYRLKTRGNLPRGPLRSRQGPWFRSPSERVAYILRLLTTAESALSIYDLADQLFVSESTIEADLTKDRALLAEF